MDRIKNLDEIIIGDFDVLAEIISPKKSDLIIPDSLALEIGEEDYAKVIKVGKDVVKYQLGDVLLKLNSKNLGGFFYRKRKMMLVPSHNISIAVRWENFDPANVDKKKGKIQA